MRQKHDEIDALRSQLEELHANFLPHFIFMVSKLNAIGSSPSIGSLVLDMNLPFDGVGKDVSNTLDLHKTSI
jgi:hypothetical protein